MNLPSLIWIVAVAVASPVLFNQVCVRLREALRGRRYAAQRRRRHAILASLRGEFSFPAYVAHKRADGLLDLVAEAHASSIVAQDRYQREIVRSAASLALAFAALAVSVTLVRDLPSVKMLLAWIDLVALVFALYHFILARRALPLWIEGRARTELLRQYAFLSLLFPSLPESRANIDLTSSFEAERDRIEHEIIHSKRENLAEAITESWNNRRYAISEVQGDIQDVSSNVLRLYLDRRCLSQVAWYCASRERVQRAADNRVRLLTFLYGLSIFLASAKVILLYASVQLGSTLVEVLACALLMATGGAAAISALYVGQNSRSLIHRYRAQERETKQWLNSFTSFYRAGLMEEQRSEQGSNIDLRVAILGFEDLMIKELTDWVDISEHDSIELGP